MRPAYTLVLPPAHPKTILRYLQWLKRPRLLGASMLTMLLINLAIIIALAVLDNIHMLMYTYWNFFMVTAFLFLSLIGLWTQGWFEVSVALVLWPLVFGSVWLVAVIITIVVIINPDVYVNATICGSGKLSFDTVRVADWVLHGLPIVEVFLLMLFDYKIYLRTLIFHLLRSRGIVAGSTYLAYCEWGPIFPLGLYALITNPSKHYPTGLATWAQILIVIAVDMGVMTTWLLALLVRVDDVRKMVPFYGAAELSRARALSSQVELDTDDPLEVRATLPVRNTVDASGTRHTTQKLPAAPPRDSVFSCRSDLVDAPTPLRRLVFHNNME